MIPLHNYVDQLKAAALQKQDVPDAKAPDMVALQQSLKASHAEAVSEMGDCGK